MDKTGGDKKPAAASVRHDTWGIMEKIASLAYATHDGTELIGDLYLPDGPGPHPAVIAVHGGGWQAGDRQSYRHVGPLLTDAGIALFSIEYRLATPGRPSYPAAVGDVMAAVRFVRANAAKFRIDPARLGLMGDSAGAHLAALVALAGATPRFATLHADDPTAGVSCAVKAVVGIYGVYDMAAQWNHDALCRPADQITEKFLGRALPADRAVYFESSPLSYATTDNAQIAFQLAVGTEDDVVDRASQTDAFLLALKQAKIYARPVVIQGAGHFWAAWPLDETDSPMARYAPGLLRFLAEKL